MSNVAIFSGGGDSRKGRGLHPGKRIEKKKVSPCRGLREKLVVMKMAERECLVAKSEGYTGRRDRGGRRGASRRVFAPPVRRTPEIGKIKMQLSAKERRKLEEGTEIEIA